MAVTPYEAGIDVLNRADALLSLDTTGTPEDIRTDLRRLSWALASASIDTFLHWRVARADLDAGMLPKDLRNLDINFEHLVDMGKKSISSRKSGVTNRPLVMARNALKERILLDTYQSSRGVERALKMCGVTDCWGKLSKEMGESKSDIIAHLNLLAHRRNQIVHEGDIQRKSRPRNLSHQSITRAEIDSELQWVRKFMEALGKIA